MNLDARLLAAAAYVERGSRVADIGTDHAHLPIHLIRNGISEYVYACDINEGPLKNAAANIKFTGTKNIETRLGSGLQPLKPSEINTVIIAGMGGEVIADIIADCHWIKSGKYNIILQPMSRAYDLRRYLCENGFSILGETAVSSAGRIYTVINVKFTNTNKKFDNLFYYFGKLFETNSPDNRAYIEWVIKILTKQINDMSGTERMAQKRRELKAVVARAMELLEKHR